MNEPPRTTILVSGDVQVDQPAARRGSGSCANSRRVSVRCKGHTRRRRAPGGCRPCRRRSAWSGPTGTVSRGPGRSCWHSGYPVGPLAGPLRREILTPGEQELLLPRFGGPLPLRLGREESADGASISAPGDNSGMRPDTCSGPDDLPGTSSTSLSTPSGRDRPGDPSRTLRPRRR